VEIETDAKVGIKEEEEEEEGGRGRLTVSPERPEKRRPAPCSLQKEKAPRSLLPPAPELDPPAPARAYRWRMWIAGGTTIANKRKRNKKIVRQRGPRQWHG
jgi:hypothetical protein